MCEYQEWCHLLTGDENGEDCPINPDTCQFYQEEKDYQLKLIEDCDLLDDAD